MPNFIELTNKFNTKVILCDIGASIYDIKTLDKDNNLESIVYTTKNRGDFENEKSYLGKTIGRTGGRISNSKFILNNVEYHIPSSDPNGLHGGNDGLSYKHFLYTVSDEKCYTEVVFSYYSKDMESGYPGNLTLNVIYRLYKNINKLTLTYEGRSSKDTLLNLSNHTYFNLSGDAKSNILSHNLYINSSKMERIEKLIPKEIVDCNELYSFKHEHKIGDYIKNKEIIDNTNGYDFPYIFDSSNEYDYKIRLYDPVSKRVLKLNTTYPAVVVYTCNYVSHDLMNNDEYMMQYYAICLEAMFHPNSINSKFLIKKNDILEKGKLYNQTIEYLFEVADE